MSRHPWTSSRSPGAFSDEGGMERLETDVMRFMAILAFCLVAIFALVQSAPRPAQTEKVPKVAKVVPEAAVAEPASVPQQVAKVPKVVPDAAPNPTPDAAQAVPAAPPAPDPRPRPETGPETEPDKGFSLRFASDAALVGLVERDEVALYAFARDRVWRFMIVDGRPTFRTADSPGGVHEMMPGTVPVAVLAGLRRSVVLPPGGLRWGVTLPPPTAAALHRVVAASDGGELVIDADGFLRLEDPT